MSRRYKDRIVDTTDDLSAGTMNAAGAEQLSGADLAQLLLAAENGSPAAVDAAGVKTVGTNTAMGGRSNAACSGADLESTAFTQ